MLGPISEAIVELTFFVSFWVLIIHLIIQIYLFIKKNEKICF